MNRNRLLYEPPTLTMEPGPSDNMVALVTGGYKNIGYAISRELKELDYHVIATYRSEERRAMEASRDLDIEVHFADMSNEKDVDHLFKHLRSRNLLVGVLVNNVSSFPTGPLEEIDPAEFRGAFESCVYSSFYSINRSIPDMKRIGGGSIVNIGMAGIGKVKGYIDVAAHASAKTALAVLTRSYALELENDNIRVNMASPGMVDRPEKDDKWREMMRSIAPMGKLISERDVASVVVDLIMDKNRTGEVVDIV